MALNVATPEKDRSVGLTTRTDWLATPVQQAFIEHLREECRLDHTG